MSLSFVDVRCGPKEALAGTLWWGFGEAPPIRGDHRRGDARELRRALGEPPRRALAPVPPAHGLATSRARRGARADRPGADAESSTIPRYGSRSPPGPRIPMCVRRRRGDAVANAGPRAAPARCEESVAGLVAACAEHDVALVPRGGGTSLVGRGRHRRPRRLRDARRARPAASSRGCSRRSGQPPGDRRTRHLRSGAGRRPARLRARGPAPPESFARSTVGGWVATGALGQLLRGAHLATPVGVIETVAGQAAGGPDLLAPRPAGRAPSGGVTRVELACRARPGGPGGAGARLCDLAQGLVALRRLAQDGLAPSCARCREARTTCRSARDWPAVSRAGGSGLVRGGALLILGGQDVTEDAAAARARPAIGPAGGGAARPGVDTRGLRCRAPSTDRTSATPRSTPATSPTASMSACTWRALPIVRASASGAPSRTRSASSLIGCRVTHPGCRWRRTHVRIYAPGAGDEIERWRAVQGAAHGALRAGAGLAPGRGVGRHSALAGSRDRTGEPRAPSSGAEGHARPARRALNPGVLVDQVDPACAPVTSRRRRSPRSRARS